MNIIQLKTRHSLNLQLEKSYQQRRLCLLTVSIATILAAVCLLFLSGCGTIQSPITIQAFQSTVTISEQFAIESHPEVVPEIRAATGIVCAEAAKTNTSPAGLVAAVNAANLSATGKLIVNSSLAVYNVVYAAVGTNQAVIHEYENALCAGMQGGLPPENATVQRKAILLPPHLR